MNYHKQFSLKIKKHHIQTDMVFLRKGWDKHTSYPSCLTTQAFGFGTGLRTNLLKNLPLFLFANCPLRVRIPANQKTPYPNGYGVF